MEINVNYAKLESEVYTLLDLMSQGDYTQIAPKGTLGVTVDDVRYIVTYSISGNKGINILDYQPV